MWSLQVYTCENGEKKYLFAYDFATNVNEPNLRYIRCVLKNNHGMYGLKTNIGAWTAKWNPYTKSSQQVLDQKAERMAATCRGN